MATTWLPNETFQMRRQLQRVLLSRRDEHERFRLSDFLTESNILILGGDKSKVDVVKALVQTLPGRDHEAALQAIWNRERVGSLMARPDVEILLGRLDSVYHMRAALGVCPEGRTRLFVVLVGPTSQTHLHMNLLTSVSYLFRDKHFVEKLLNSNSPRTILQQLMHAEAAGPQSAIQRALGAVKEYWHAYYGWGQRGGQRVV